MVTETLLGMEYVSISEASRRAHISPNGIRYWIRRGQIETLKTPLGRVVAVDSLDLFLKGREVKKEDEDE